MDAAARIKELEAELEKALFGSNHRATGIKISKAVWDGMITRRDARIAELEAQVAGWDNKEYWEDNVSLRGHLAQLREEVERLSTGLRVEIEKVKGTKIHAKIYMGDVLIFQGANY